MTIASRSRTIAAALGGALAVASAALTGLVASGRMVWCAVAEAGAPASPSSAADSSMEGAFTMVGSIRDLRALNPDQIPIESPVEVTTGGPPFLMSDNPEWVKEPGVHSLATFTGRARFFWFIANHMSPAGGPLYVTLVGENRGEHPARVRVTRLGYSYNGIDSELAGQEALYQYLAGANVAPDSSASAEVLIPAGGAGVRRTGSEQAAAL